MARRIGYFLLAFSVATLLSLHATGVAQAGDPSPAERGNLIFQEHCSTCHGDQGQGLAEWRLTFDPAHQNCDRYNCHTRQHPPGGFYLPNNYAPKIIGENTLTDLQTAQDLYNFVSTRMPFQEPGSLAASDYWLIVAFLLSRHGIHVDQVSSQNASSILLHPGAPTDGSYPYLGLAGLAGLVLLGGGLVAVVRYRPRNRFPR